MFYWEKRGEGEKEREKKRCDCYGVHYLRDLCLLHVQLCVLSCVLVARKKRQWNRIEQLYYSLAPTELATWSFSFFPEWSVIKEAWMPLCHCASDVTTTTTTVAVLVFRLVFTSLFSFYFLFLFSSHVSLFSHLPRYQWHSVGCQWHMKKRVKEEKEKERRGKRRMGLFLIRCNLHWHLFPSFLPLRSPCVCNLISNLTCMRVKEKVECVSLCACVCMCLNFT